MAELERGFKFLSEAAKTIVSLPDSITTGSSHNGFFIYATEEDINVARIEMELARNKIVNETSRDTRLLEERKNALHGVSFRSLAISIAQNEIPEVFVDEEIGITLLQGVRKVLAEIEDRRLEPHVQIGAYLLPRGVIFTQDRLSEPIWNMQRLDAVEENLTKFKDRIFTHYATRSIGEGSSFGRRR